MSTYGTMIPINLFGESHGEAIGIVINNLPAGIKLDLEAINYALTLRRPKSNLSTPRQEQDEYEFLSGFFNGVTTGSPLTIIIKNKDKRSRDYTPNVMRPSHADFPAHIKYNGHEDYRGGGHFSGRITAPLMILGAISKQILQQKDIIIGSHIRSIKDVEDTNFEDITLQKEVLEKLLLSDFPIINANIKKAMESVIIDAKNNQNSVGGVVETAILGIAPGYGEPFFDSVESTISHLIFSVPAIKGIAFGKGFDITKLYGSESNDSLYVENGTIKTKTNHSGGINGGITNGMPIVFKTAVKPTSSVGLEQDTVDIESMTNVKHQIQGRHDPCIVHRVIHVINAITAYAVLEVIARKEGLTWVK
jgi:chorismate synthase